MPDPIVVDAPVVDAGLADADLGGMSDLEVLDATIAKSLAGAEAPADEPADEPAEPVTEPVVKEPAAETKPAESEVKPEVKADTKADDPAGDEPDEGQEGVTIKKLTGLVQTSPEFKALLDKNPGLRNQLFVTARRAERSGQYDELFQTPALAKEAKAAADDYYFNQNLYNGKTPEESNKFWRKMQWDDLVKDEQGNPKVDPQTGRYQTYGNYDYHTAHYRAAVYDQAAGLAEQVRQSGQAFKDTAGNEISADDLLMAVHILRAATNGVPLPAEAGQAPAAQGAPASQPTQPQVPAHVQRELEELRARDRATKQAQGQTAEQFQADVMTQMGSAVETDVKNLLAKRLPANAGITEYMREMIVRDTAGEIDKLAKSNSAHQAQIQRALNGAPKTAEGAKTVVAIRQAFAKEMIPRILARVISKAVPGITASNQSAQTKVKTQQARKEVQSSGGVSTPSRPDARTVAREIEDKAKKAGKQVDDMALLEGIMAGVHGR